MVAGVRIQNDAGTAQLDNRFQNLVLIQKGAVTLGANWTFVSTTGGPYASITVPDYYGYPPLIVLVSETKVYVRDAIKDGSNWVFGLAGLYATAAGGVVEYYLFGPPHSGLPQDPYGMRLRRPDNTLAYHSSWKPLRVVAQIDNSSAPALSYTGVAGRKYGVAHIIDAYSQTAPLPSGTWIVNGSGTVTQTVGATTTMSSGQIYSTNWGTFPPFPTEFNQPTARHLVVDVTHY